MPNIEGLVPSDQAAEILGISRKTLWRYSYIYDDFPEPARIGRTILHDPDALRAWRYEHPPRRTN